RELREHEPVHRIAGAGRHRGERRPLRRHEGPVRLVAGALLDPAPQSLLLLLRERPLVAARRRHAELLLVARAAVQELALVEVARDDRGSALARGVGALRLVETQVRAPLLLVLAMAAEAAVGEQRTNVAVISQRDCVPVAARRTGGDMGAPSRC